MRRFATTALLALSLGACSGGDDSVTEAQAPDPAVRSARCDQEVRELCADLMGNEQFQCIKHEARRCLTEAAGS